MKTKKIPVYILTGFLGSGKTTILLKMLEEFKQRQIKPGIVLNEIGSINVEEHYFQNEKVVELLDGCICCSIKDDLISGLQQFLKSENQVDVLLIEGTGIANPKEIVEALTDIHLIDHFEVFSIISVIDSSRFLEYGSIFASSKEIRELLSEQLVNSTLVVLNKMDLVNQKTITKIRKKLDSQLKHDPLIIETTFGKIEADLLLKKRVESVTISATSHHTHDKGHHKHHHHHSFQVMKIENVPAINLRKFEKWLNTLPETIVRGKGIIRTNKSGEDWCHFQFSSKQIQLTPIKRESIMSPCLIFIGSQLNSSVLEESFREEVVG
ncbi:CobW family GTP-binding protein [Heyndrickxia sp. NPDC080065]|uniref:CobW family GTP-binding protein n=1 Tax=Heyndrickxia sp. NPDC080065 TaxID=3390568 RepID=UPI003D07937A